MGSASRVKPLVISPRCLEKNSLLTTSHGNRQVVSPSYSMMHVYTMTVLEVSTRSKRCRKTAKMDQASGLHRSCHRTPDNFRTIRERLQQGHRRQFSHFKKVSPQPLMKFTLQFEG